MPISGHVEWVSAAMKGVSERDFLVGEKMIEAKGKRSERNGSLGERDEHYVHY